MFLTSYWPLAMLLGFVLYSCIVFPQNSYCGTGLLSSLRNRNRNMYTCRERVVNHIRYRSKVCRNHHFLNPPPYTIEQANDFDNAVAEANRDLHHKGSRRHKAVLPRVKLQGPLVQITTLSLGTLSTHHPLGRGHIYWC